MVTLMDVESDGRGHNLEGYRDYLRLLAELQIDRPLQGKIDLSGVVQQTMLEAYRELTKPQRRQLDDPAAWLRRILANNLADEIRKLKTQRRNAYRESSLEVALEQSSLRLQSWLATDQSSPSAQSLRQEQSLGLTAALNKLSTAQREALVLRHFRDWSLQQIAEQMGRTPAAVAGLLKRGLEQLRRELRDWE